MMNSLKKLWISRSPTERAAALVVLSLLCAVLYCWFTYTATHARARMKIAVETLRAQSAGMEKDAAEILRLRSATPPAQAAPTDLRTAVQAQIDHTGLSSSLTKIDAQTAQSVQVTFGSLPFPAWLALVRNLQEQRIRMETSRIEALPTSGMVSVTATLSGARAD